MAKIIWIAAMLAAGAIIYTLALAVYFGSAHSQEPTRWLLVKIYAHGYSDEIACNLDLAQAAMMSPAGTRFKCERVK